MGTKYKSTSAQPATVYQAGIQGCVAAPNYYYCRLTCVAVLAILAVLARVVYDRMPVHASQAFSTSSVPIL